MAFHTANDLFSRARVRRAAGRTEAGSCGEVKLAGQAGNDERAGLAKPAPMQVCGPRRNGI